MLLILLDWPFGLVEVALGKKSSLVSMAVPGSDAVGFLDSALGRLIDLVVGEIYQDELPNVTAVGRHGRGRGEKGYWLHWPCI